MFFVSLYRQFKFASQNFLRNFWLSVVTITIIILSLFSINTLLAIEGVSRSVVKAVTDRVDIAVYFKASTPEAGVLLILRQIEDFEETKEVVLVSADEALAAFKTRHLDDPLVNEALSELSDNPLGPTLQVKARDLAGYQTLLAKINGLNLNSLVEDIEFANRQLLISKINDLTHKVGLVLTVLSVLFAAISVMVVVNTIRLGIYAHREEITIMKLVGASNMFTRLPFIIEGWLYALLAVLAFWLLFFSLVSWLDPLLAGFLQEINFSIKNFFQENFWTYFGQEFLILVAVNSLSAWLAIRRYLKV